MVLSVVTALVAAPAIAAPRVDLQCEGYSDPTFVMIEGEGTFDLGDGFTAEVSGSTVTFSGAETVSFRVKAGAATSGVISGETTFTVNWTTRGWQTPGISNVVIYATCVGSTCVPPSGS